MKISSDLINLVKTASPLIASALGSPIAGIALSLVSSIFGLSHDNDDQDEILSHMKNDPECQVKLRELEYKHSEELLKILSDDILTILHLKKDLETP